MSLASEGFQAPFSNARRQDGTTISAFKRTSIVLRIHGRRSRVIRHAVTVGKSDICMTLARQNGAPALGQSAKWITIRIQPFITSAAHRRSSDGASDWQIRGGISSIFMETYLATPYTAARIGCGL